MIELLVIADDFTGALDTGVQFAAKGIETCVVLGRTFDPAAYGEHVRVACVDVETRHLPPAEAYEAVRDIVSQAVAAGVGTIFKKVDSTLRGQIGSELAAVLDATGAKVLGFVPAYPATGRTTERGIHLLDGRPIHESVFGRDPFEPTLRSDVAGIIREQRPVQVVNVPVGQTPEARDGVAIEVYDATTEQHVADAVEWFARSGRRVMAGCAGLARALASRMSRGCGAVGAPEAKDGVLFVCGSLNPISHRQVARAQEEGFALLTVPDHFLRRGEGLDALLDQVCGLVDRGEKVMLLPPRADEASVDHLGYDREVIAGRIGQIIRGWYRRGFDHTLVITGGDTLHAFLDCLGPGVVLRPRCELQPGVVCSTLHVDGGARALQLISKAGGFGTEDVYSLIARQTIVPGAHRRNKEGSLR